MDESIAFLERNASTGGTSEPTDSNNGGNALSVRNADFLRSIFTETPEGTTPLVCNKSGDPTTGSWKAKPSTSFLFPENNNNYFCLSAFKPFEDGTYKARKELVVACYGLMLDDLGTKIPMASLNGFRLPSLIETSPGNHQGLILFKEPVTDLNLLDRISKALVAKGLCDPGATGPATRWARLPVGINGKGKHLGENGAPFQCRLVQWNPEIRYTPQEIIDQLELDFETDLKNEATGNPDNVQTIKNYLARLNPDCGYQDWVRVGMAIHHETSGKDYGLETFDEWSSRGGKYKGRREIESKWRSFNFDKDHPITMASLVKMVKDAGGDGSTQRFRRCETDIISPPEQASTLIPSNSGSSLTPLESAQQRFGLLNTGKVSVFDRKSLNTFTANGTASELRLSNRSDGNLLIKRFIKAHYPEVNANKILEEFWDSPNTVCYDGVEFNPRGNSGNQLNLWVGPTIQPQKGDWSRIQDFLLEVICSEDQEAFEYLTKYIAHALQHPEVKPGVLIILLGGQGIGKGTFGRILQKIWTATYIQVNNIDSITGNFNGPLERAYIVFMDEALFVGNRRASDALKSLVTEEVLLINEKHQPVRQIRSFHRFIAATNADHFKHTDTDDRRDFTLRVSDQHKGDSDYWQSLNMSMENGGIEAMAYDLQQMDLSAFNVRSKPNTIAFTEQKLRSLNPIAKWWHNCLTEGCLDEGQNWPTFSKTCNIITHIMEFTGGRVYTKPTAVSVAVELKQLCPSVKNKQKQEQFSRARGFEFPPLSQARKEFERYINGNVPWPEGD